MAKFTSKRGGGPRDATKTSISVRKANAAGFEKRRARSAKAAANADPDVYDYQPAKSRRGNVSLALDEDESHGAGYDDDDDLDEEEGDRSRKRPRLVGEGEEDERIESDEDEEIDSDAAFEESDEERFAEFNFKKKGPSKVKKAVLKAKRSLRFAEIDLNEEEGAAQDESDLNGTSQASEDEEEEEEEEEEGEDDEFLDVLDVLDGRGESDLGEDNSAPVEKEVLPNGSHNDEDVDMEKEDEEGEDSEGEEEEEEENESTDEDAVISGSDEDVADTSALDALGSFVSGLEVGAKRKASDEDKEVEWDGATRQVKKKKRSLKDRTESGVEGEFGARAAGSSKLSLDDLLTPLAPKQGGLAALKKSLKPLASSSNPKNQPLAAPLPTRTQERLEREAAYEQTKQEVDKWTDTMKRIQEAEHLSFPLQVPRTVKMSNLELTSKFKPSTELESSIDQLLKSAKLREEDINKTEDLMMKDLSIEEVAERRAELRKMRELAFRADAKAKRVAKIKSKAFRRIQKKERAKLLSKLDASGALDEGDAEEERLKAEVERARERATLKHKNTGKWAKAMKARGELNVDQRKDIHEMLERGERLRRRIQGAGSRTEDGSGSDSSDEDAEDEDDVLRIKANAFEELKKIREEDDEEDTDNKQNAKSVFQMKFMKDAAARKNFALDRDIDDFRREVGDLPVGSDIDDAEDVDADIPATVERVNGRMVFRPGPHSRSSLMLPPPPPSAISETSTLRSHDSAVHSPILTIHDDSSSTPPSSTPPASVLPAEPSNPWLVEPSSSSKLAKRKNELIVGKNVTRAQKSEVAMQKQLKKGTEEREREQDDAMVEIVADDVSVLKSTEIPDHTVAPTLNGIVGGGKKNVGKKKKAKKDKGKDNVAQQLEEEDSDANSEVDEQETALKKGKKITAFEQRELVARAFAGDNVVREFADEKRKEMEADAPREIDTTLAGWGSWGGAGLKKAPPKVHLIKKVAGIDPKSRADFGKAHVIISERRDKKALKFAVKDLPYPYTSKTQFEARMSTPLGTEWNTRLGFQRGTLPRVVKKMGTVIDPLEKL